MKSVDITRHNKDFRSDKIEPWQLVWHVGATFVWQRPSEIWKKKWGGHIWTSDFILSFCLRGSGWGEKGRERGAVTGWEREWLAPLVTEIWEEPNLFSMYACSCCQRAALTPPPPPPLYCPWPPQQAHKSLQRLPSPLMTVPPHSADHSALNHLLRRG